MSREALRCKHVRIKSGSWDWGGARGFIPCESIGILGGGRRSSSCVRSKKRRLTNRRAFTHGTDAVVRFLVVCISQCIRKSTDGADRYLTGIDIFKFTIHGTRLSETLRVMDNVEDGGETLIRKLS